MVQRKVSISNQSDHLLLLKSNLKPIYFQHQDGKNRGSDMKKKMKRSKSIKISDFESFNPPPLKKITTPPEKSPALASPATPVVLQKQKSVTLASPATVGVTQRQSLMKSGDGSSPNYMKETSSSEARKERLRRISDRSEKPAKKSFPVRGLIKTPNFKPLRSPAKKSSVNALCAEDVDVQKATCSSTLKDSKFPAYLMLNPGGTESEGTSVVKVCPYSYCSLNGHHHTPSPPLKCFLKAKRRSLKNQKSSKTRGGSSPRKGVPPCDEAAGVIDEIGKEFFVEIYESEKKNVADEEGNKDQVSENLSGASAPESEIDFEENFVTDFLGYLSGSCDEGSGNEEGENVADMEWKEGEREHFDDEPEIVGPDKDGEILGDDVLKELFCEEESVSCSLEFNESDSEMEDAVMNWGIWEAKSEECDDSGDFTSDENSMEEAIVELEVAEFENDAIELLERRIGDSTEVFDEIDKAETNDCQKFEEIEKSNQFENDATDVLERRIEDSSEVFDEIEKAEINDCQKFEEIEADTSVATSMEDTIGELEVAEKSNEFENVATDLVQRRIEDSSEIFDEIDKADTNDCQMFEEIEADQSSGLDVTAGELGNEHDSAKNVIENQDSLEKFGDPEEEQNNSMICSSINSDGNETRVENTEIEAKTESDRGNSTSSGSKYRRGINSGEELAELKNRKWIIKCGKPTAESDEEREFNPKEPNFLPIVPNPAAEKVDLKHQNMDGRKNSEEWMIDYALQQAVTKLAPARKRKVALLVEAFEKVLPIPKYNTHNFRNNTGASPFSPRPIQACS
ncbi:calmodulin binding protein PICBP-like [Euphorbia lathyris]|uniref:calmodulin binding protein PICBP-like n=1 Tax=Euphorbia lathyris TaxID=212925 RepID=UPI00331400D3